MGREYSVRVLLIIILSLGLSSCSERKISGASSSLSSNQGVNPSVQCELAPENLRSPKSIADSIALINSLPKPVSIHCFLKNLELPLNFVATSSSFSAQPSPGIESPRIFLIHEQLIMSVVPGGFGMSAVEFGEVINSNLSIKGEIHFPVDSDLATDAAFSSILNNSTGGTSCRICHNNEVNQGGDAYASRMVAPDPFEIVSKEDVMKQAESCSPETDWFRCEMLRVILSKPDLKEEGWPF